MMLRQRLAIAAATPNLIPMPTAHAPLDRSTRQIAVRFVATNLGAVFAPNYAWDYARCGGDYAEPQYGPPVLSWFNSGLNGQGRRLAGLGRSPRGGFLSN